MKNVILLFIVALSVALTGCSVFDTEPVNPKIIGTANVMQKGSVFYVDVNSTNYGVVEVYVGEIDERSGKQKKMEPVEGMVVTVFECQNRNSPIGKKGIYFMLGDRDEAQIEDVFHGNYTIPALLAIFVLFVFIYMACYICIVEKKS